MSILCLEGLLLKGEQSSYQQEVKFFIPLILHPTLALLLQKVVWLVCWLVLVQEPS